MTERFSPSLLRASRRARAFRYYWIVDPQLRSLEILELAADGTYRHALGATEGSVENVLGCEGLTLDLDAVWAEIDLLKTQPAPEE